MTNNVLRACENITEIGTECS